MSAIDFDIRRLQQRTRRTQWQTATRPGIRILELPTAQVRIRCAGTGPRTLVFACDMPNVVESYDEVIRLLAGDYRVVCFEQVGFGFSYPKPGFGFTLEDYVSVMADMLRALGPGPCTLVSPCVNVFQALLVAHRHPQLVDGLVLMQAVRWHAMRTFSAWAMNRFVMAGAWIPLLGNWLSRTPYVGQLLWAAMERSIARKTHPHVIHRSSERPERFAQIAQPLYAAHDNGACACFSSGHQRYFDPAVVIPVVAQPALVLWATADPAHAGEDPKSLLSYVPHARWLEIPDTGHHLDLENPEAVTAAIRSFLEARVSPAESAGDTLQGTIRSRCQRLE